MTSALKCGLACLNHPSMMFASEMKCLHLSGEHDIYITRLPFSETSVRYRGNKGYVIVDYISNDDYERRKERFIIHSSADWFSPHRDGLPRGSSYLCVPCIATWLLDMVKNRDL